MTYSTYLNVCMGAVAVAVTGLLLLVVWLFFLEPVWEAAQGWRERRRIRRDWRRFDGIGPRTLTLSGGYPSSDTPSPLPKIDGGPGPGSLPKKGGYSGSRPASEVPPPPSAPSATIRPKAEPSSLRDFLLDELDRYGVADAHDDDRWFQSIRRAKDAYQRELARVSAERRVPRPPTAGQLHTPGPDEPVTENLSGYIDGETPGPEARWTDAVTWADEQVASHALLNPPPPIDPAKIVGVELKVGGVALDCMVGGCRWGAVGSERCECKPGAATDVDDFPDPDKDDCPVWLPQDPIVPHADRTPCRLDHLHDGDHEPTFTATLERAEAIAKEARTLGFTWAAATARYEAEGRRQWVQLTATCAPPLGDAVKDVDLLKVAASLGETFGFELVSNVTVVKVAKAPGMAVKVGGGR